MYPILLGLIFGFIFGFLLNKGGVSNFNTIVGQLLFKNLTVLNIMMTAIIVGGVTLYALVDLHMLAALPAKASSVQSSAVGGLIFGIGMALLGYCPGTALAAIGQGAKDALFGVLGGLVGALLFARYGAAVKTWIGVSEPTNETFVQVLHLSPYLLFILLFFVLVVVNFVYRRF